MQKGNRITGKIYLPQFFNKGIKFGSRFFLLIYLPNSYGRSRFVFITPRTLDKRSTVRNRLRRRAREWVRKNVFLLKPRDVVIICKKETVIASRQQFYEELAKIFTRAGY